MSSQHSLTPQELMGTMKKLHEALVLLAGRVHAIHTALQNYKDDYSTYRRRVLGDPVDIFSKGSGGQAVKSTGVGGSQMMGSGPSPFGGASDPLSRTLNHLTGVSGVQQTSGGINYTGGGILTGSSGGGVGSSFSTPGRPAGLFGSMAQTPSSSSSFQLQSPPAGSKRNKR